MRREEKCKRKIQLFISPKYHSVVVKRKVNFCKGIHVKTFMIHNKLRCGVDQLN